MSNPGEIKFRARAKQLIEFDKLNFARGITPTDIDGAIDFSGELFIFLEYKCGEAQMPHGQRLFIERLVNTITAAGKDALALICRHDHPPETDIDAANAEVIELKWKAGEWRAPKHQITARQAIEEVYWKVFIEPF